MTDDPGFRHEAHATVEPTPTEEIAHLRRQRATLEARLAEVERRDDWMRTQLANCIEDLERLESVVLDAKGWRCLIGDLRDALAALHPESETR